MLKLKSVIEFFANPIKRIAPNVEVDELSNETTQQLFLKYLQLYDVKQYHQDYTDRIHQRPKKVKQVEHYLLIHKDLKPKYLDQKVL